MPRVKAFDKDEVLGKAMELFWRKGYNATSYTDLVQHLGINRQSIYDTFGDKNELYNLALDRFTTTSNKQMIEELGKYDSPKSKLRAFLYYIVSQNLNDASKGCFMVNSSIELGNNDPEVASKACSNMQQIVMFLESTVKEAQERGEISQKHKANAVALFLYTLLTGLKANAKLALPKQVYDDILLVTLDTLE